MMAVIHCDDVEHLMQLRGDLIEQGYLETCMLRIVDENDEMDVEVYAWWPWRKVKQVWLVSS